MGNSSEDFKILLDAVFDSSQIQNRLNSIKDLSVKIDDVELSDSAISRIKKTFDKANVPLNIDFGNMNSVQRQAQNIGKDVGELISQSAQKAIGSVTSTGLNKYFQISQKSSRSFQKEMEGLVGQWTGNKGKLIDVKIDTRTSFDKDAQQNIERLHQATVTYKNDLDEVTRKTIAWRQIGSTMDFQGQEQALYGFVEVAGQYSKSIDQIDKQTQKFIDRQKQAVANLKNSLSQILSSAKNGSKPIETESLVGEITAAQQAIDNLAKVSVQSFTDANIQAETAISDLKIKIKELQKEQYAATSLRTKDIVTIKQDELHKLDAFISKMQASGEYTKSLQEQAKDLKKTLSEVVDSDGLTQYLNKFSNLQSLFQATETATKSSNQSNKLEANKSIEVGNLQRLQKELSEAGVLSDETRTELEKFNIALNNVGSQSALTTWRAEFKAFRGEMQEAVTVAQQFEQVRQIKDNMAMGFYNDQVEQQIEKYNRLGLELPNVQAKIDALVVAEKELFTTMNDDNATVEQQITALNNFNAALKNTNAANSLASSMYMTRDAVDSLILKLENFLTNNSAMTKDAKAQIQSLISSLKNTDDVTKSMGNNAVVTMRRVEASMRSAGKLGDSFFMTLKKGMEKFSYWTSATFMVMKVVNEIRKGVQVIFDFDEALTNINYTMDVSSIQLKEVGNAAIQTSKNLHTSLSTVMDAVKTYANANETAQSIIEKSKPTIMMSNVSGMNVEDSVDILQGTMEQFDLAEDKLMHVSDVIQTVSASMPYDFSKGIKELSEGIQASGSVANDAGYDLENYTALLGTLISKTRQSGSEIGRALRTMFVRTTKASSSALAGGEVSEEDISNAETALRRVGIEVRSDVNTFRNFDDIMGDLYKKVDSLSEVDLSNIAYEVASKIVLEYIVIYSVYTQKIGISVKSR